MNNKIEVHREVRKDSSYADTITDDSTGFAEIREYDAQGAFVEAIYGRFVAVNEYSEE